MRKYTLVSVLAAIGAAVYWLLSASRAMAEKTPYRVLRVEGPFELRDHPPLPVATTPMGGRDSDDAFMRLFLPAMLV